MKSIITLTVILTTLLTTTAHANVAAELEELNVILNSQTVLRKITSYQNLHSITKRGESFDLKLISSDGSCVQYNVMALDSISNTGTSYQIEKEIVIDEFPSPCK